AAACLKGGALDAPAAQLPAVGGEVGQACLGLFAPGEMVLERFRVQRMAVADLDPQPLQEGGVDRFRGPGRARFGSVLGQLASPCRIEFLLCADLYFVQAPDTILGPSGGGLPDAGDVVCIVAVRAPCRLGQLAPEV